ncbi:MAG: prepilin-type N-terminal cleavage/methylation domain-containing protein [Lentisphaerae bacterium]|nr:prepilin-type N-terminal cleavage/methylation domain-containing protein [Lentisphaerota bacterium]
MTPRHGRRDSGFTLVETLFVIAIAVILLAVGLAAHRGAQRAARKGKARADLEMLRGCVDAYVRREGGLPPDVTNALRECAAGIRINARGRPQDPWNNEYCYVTNGPRAFLLFSAGADGQTNSADDVRLGQD